MAHEGLLLCRWALTLSVQDVLKNPMILRGYINTVIIVLLGVTVNIILVGRRIFSVTENVLWKTPL